MTSIDMDSNALKHDAKFKDKLKDLNVGEEQLANLTGVFDLLGVCNNASVDGTFRITTTNWRQMFMLMAKYDKKFIPISFGFLPMIVKQILTIFVFHIVCEQI